MDYIKYGIDPDQAMPAAQQDNFIQLEAQALELESIRDAEDDLEDREILAERASVARERADQARTAQKMTKGEARAVRRNLLENQLRAQAQEHLVLESHKSIALKGELPGIEARQREIERRVAVMEKILGDNV